ncbi:hypothetical protein PIB30_054623 [Stylosanthes scabra]|uniref:Uncharacterized protein n=1 Tax=Stylosanthes scabra TaxID=79078 RepID=A0ABU6UI92_9FABA|nr:hypothetical protein [Stylosanthes scabra]
MDADPEAVLSKSKLVVESSEGHSVNGIGINSVLPIRCPYGSAAKVITSQPIANAQGHYSLLEIIKAEIKLRGVKRAEDCRAGSLNQPKKAGWAEDLRPMI